MLNKIKQYKKQLLVGLAIAIAFTIGLSLSSTHTIIQEKEVVKTVEKPTGVTQEQYDTIYNKYTNLGTLHTQCKTAISQLMQTYVNTVQAYQHAINFKPDATGLLQDLVATQEKTINDAKTCDPSMASTIDWAKATR